MTQEKHLTIQKYSCMASVFILIPAIAESQAIYTDIEPDIEIQFDGQTASVDLDNDGVIDFAFLKSTDTYDWGISGQRLRQRIWAGPQLISNEIAGDYFYYSAGGTITYLPYALDNSNAINDELSFQNWGYQIMAVAVANTEFPDDWAFHGGHWIVDENPHFMGVRFLGGDNCTHYGWIRCSVVDTVHTLIIFDYAFELKCGIGIVAGDTVGDTTEVNIEQSVLKEPEIYVYQNALHISLLDLSGKSELLIYNCSGEQIYDQLLNYGNSTIYLSQPSGIYIVNVVSDGQRFSKNIFILNE